MRCRLCNSVSLEVHFDVRAQAPAIGPIAFCEACGFVQMTEHAKPEDLYQTYETPSAWKLQPHAERIIDLSEALFGLHRVDRIFEIGCNDGSFLERWRRRGYCHLAGVEPSANTRATAVANGFDVTPGFFGHDATTFSGKPLLIVARQVLEHVPDVMGFLAGVKQCLAPNGGLVIEVPDHSMNYETLDYTFWRQHVNYFTLNTLRHALEMSGFEIVHHETALFSGKALIVYATHAKHARTPEERNHDRAAAHAYREAFIPLRMLVQQSMAHAPTNWALYGAGCRAVSFCRVMGVADLIDVVIDDQPGKQGTHLDGFAYPAVRASTAFDPDTMTALLGVNAENEATVIRARRITHAVSCLPPSRLIPEFWRHLAAASGALSEARVSRKSAAA